MNETELALLVVKLEGQLTAANARIASLEGKIGKERIEKHHLERELKGATERI